MQWLELTGKYLLLALMNLCSGGHSHHCDFALGDAGWLVTILGDFESATIPYGKNWLHQKKGMHL